MREQLILLGGKIRRLRKERGMTLQELAGKTRLTAGLLSKIENFRTVPSLPVLVSIARALESDLAGLFEGMVFEQKKNWVLVHGGDAGPVEREADHGLDYRMLFETPIDAVSMQVMLVTDRPGAKKHRPVSTEGDQMLYILSGETSYRIGGECLRLQTGDLLFFDGSLPHAAVASGDRNFVMLALYFLRSTPRN